MNNLKIQNKKLTEKCHIQRQIKNLKFKQAELHLHKIIWQNPLNSMFQFCHLQKMVNVKQSTMCQMPHHTQYS